MKKKTSTKTKDTRVGCPKRDERAQIKDPSPPRTVASHPPRQLNAKTTEMGKSDKKRTPKRRQLVKIDWGLFNELCNTLYHKIADWVKGLLWILVKHAEDIIYILLLLARLDLQVRIHLTPGFHWFSAKSDPHLPDGGLLKFALTTTTCAHHPCAFTCDYRWKLPKSK